MKTDSKTNELDPNVVKESTSAPKVEQQNYCQVVPMTFEERYAMYMRCKKEELAKMLAERDRLGLDYYPQPYNPQYPWYPPYPYPGYPVITCENSSGVETSASIEV